jgi:predicted dinucleotide-binding enzyme
MRIGVIGTGRIGGNAARQLADAGHEVMLGSRDPSGDEAAAAVGGAVSVGTPREVAGHGEVVLVAVPWRALDDVVASLGSLEGKVVVDATNHFAAGGLEDLGGRTAAEVNAGRMPGARYTKAFNTLTAGFQAEAAGRSGAERAVLFLCGDDEGAKAILAGLIEDLGFAPVDVGGVAEAAIMEAPRRKGAVYGEEYREADAIAAVAAARAGRPLPPTPSY